MIVKFSRAAVGAMLLLAARTAFAGESPSNVRGGKWSVAQETATECATCTVHGPFQFLAANHGTGKNIRFSLNGMVDRIKSVRLLGDRAVVIGDLSSSGDMVTVYDLGGNRLLDEFAAINSTISPNGQFLAFQHFHPRHADTEDMSDVVLLYDLSRSQKENRTPDNQAKPNMSNAGIPVFPVKNRVDRRILPYPGSNYVVYPQFIWSPSGKTLAFVAEATSISALMEKDHTTTEIIAVAIEISGSIADAKAYLRRIPVNDLLRPTFQNKKGYKFHVGRMSLSDDGGLRFDGAEMNPGASSNLISTHDEAY
ncbi:MAG: hypothetical protein HKL90_01895 [Elusimicrobia bacterium]|nr:hypothetical protein [Elusimicrobiota bacterium]